MSRTIATLTAVVALTLAACGSGTSDTTTTFAPTTTLSQQVRVPDVVGSEASQARANLIAAGFAVKSTDRLTRDETSGLVLEQIPAAGSTVEPATVVELIVSKPFPTTVVSPTTTVVDATEAIEKIRRKASALHEIGYVVTFVDLLTDLEITRKMDRFCRDMSNYGIDIAIQADLEDIANSATRDQGLAELVVYEELWGNAVILYCQEHRSAVQGWIDEFHEDLGL